MSKIYLGKISKTYAKQFEENFYAGGKESSSWYGGVKAGDYVFPIYNTSVSKLWRVKEFSNTPNAINSEGSVRFEVVKEYKEPVSIASTFARYKHFELDLNILNKLSKSTAKEKIGFYEITCSKNCPSADQIDFNDLRSIYIALENPYQSISYKEGDIRILIDSKESLKIKDIQIYEVSKWKTYDLLLKLYEQKNKPDQRYSLKELLDFAVTDQAIKKEKFLNAAIDEIGKNGFFTLTSPIGLYDNLLVGRKRTASGKKGEDESEDEILIEDEAELTKEEFDEYKEFVDLLKFSPNLILYGPQEQAKLILHKK
ncbi:MAG: hypothetical protein IPI65_13540 [Bacteroidetes bacterium]|nr:hypothetical protein [Bacteroidota bacterium]